MSTRHHEHGRLCPTVNLYGDTLYLTKCSSYLDILNITPNFSLFYVYIHYKRESRCNNDRRYKLMVSDMVYVKCWNRKILFTCKVVALYELISNVCNLFMQSSFEIPGFLKTSHNR